MKAMLQNPPLISVIIPTCNRPAELQTCLEAFSHQDYPRSQFEIIIVDDGSKFSLTSVISSFINSLDVKLIVQANAGPAKARNTGSQYAKGQFLAFTDDDCTVAPNWLSALANRLVTAPNCLIAGKILNSLAKNPFSTASQTLLDYVYIQYNSNPELACFSGAANMALPARLFEIAGGFNASFTFASEDREFCARWLSQGHRIIYAADVEIYHAHHLSWRSFWQQHFSYGRGAFHFHQSQRRQHPGAASMQPVSFYLKLLSYPFSQKYDRPAIFISFLILLSQVATTWGLAIESKQNIDRQPSDLVLKAIE
jgi:GT2 family glycosyltransferase